LEEDERLREEEMPTREEDGETADEVWFRVRDRIMRERGLRW
jgi:hypothetical protein